MLTVTALSAGPVAAAPGAGARTGAYEVTSAVAHEVVSEAVHAGAGHACSPSLSIRGYSDHLDKATFQNTYVGNLSALAVDTDGTLAALSDRSKLFSLDQASRRPVRVRSLADEKGGELDAEGLVVERSGRYLVTSETEPSVRRYERDGRLLGRLPVPDMLRVAPAGRARDNQTFEGLTRRGRTVIASMEGALTGDGADGAGRPLVRFQTWQQRTGHGGHGVHRVGGGARAHGHGLGGRAGGRATPTAGDHDRVADRDREAAGYRLGAQYAYPVDKGLGVVELAAVPDGWLLVLERGFTAGVGNTVRLYLADTRRASDVSGVERLPGAVGAASASDRKGREGREAREGREGRDRVRPVTKRLLGDLGRCPSLGAPAKQPQTNPLLDNIEGMTVLGRAPGGRLRLLLVSDDNERATQITRLYEMTVRVGR
ncbi:esterase-like activity of phytase family protein [Streptomyces sp. NPDC003077]|uniref:esterase-like activity of phytase family protein n=1 Tax=Streptomyces sp. NPDC003077 TaxID=3154443 RepID=UPI0033ABD8F2